MKKIGLVVILVVVLLFTISVSNSFAQKWELFCTSAHGNMYYDSNSAKYLPDNKVQILEKFVPINPQGKAALLFYFQSCMMLNSAYADAKGDGSYTVSLDELNCKTNEGHVISKTVYDKNGNVLCTFQPPGEKINKNDSCFKRLYQSLCK